MILSAQSIRRIAPLHPLVEAGMAHGLTFGLGPASYDVRIAETIVLPPGGFALASTLERFDMPHYIAGSVKDKSTWARRGLAVQNTWIDPGWKGYLTLELSNHYPMPDVPHWYHRRSVWKEWQNAVAARTLVISAGCPIAQIVFEQLDQSTELPYRGRYQHQSMGPVAPRATPAAEALYELGVAMRKGEKATTVNEGSAFDGEEL